MDVYNTRYVDLNLVSAEAVRTWTFGDKLAGEPISFKKGDKETFEESFIIRVSPTNATLDKSMIRLVNSQMNDLNGLLEVKNIYKSFGGVDAMQMLIKQQQLLMVRMVKKIKTSCMP